MKSCFTAVAMTALVALTGTTALAAPITFDAAGYDNSAVQTTGFFRDVLNGSRISSGGHLVNGAATGAYTALNFTGSDNNDPYKGATTVYDTNVMDGLPTLFSGNLNMSADILIDPFNNAKGAGLLFLFNEGTGIGGLSLNLWDAGNTDALAVNFVQQTGVSTPGNVAKTQSLSGNIPEDEWFRLVLDLVFTSPTNFTATGSVFRHVTSTNPNSALGTQVGTNLVYNGALSSGILNPYEIGLVGRAVSGVEGTSVTNFSVDVSPIPTPEPGSLLLLGSGLVLLGRSASKRFKNRAHKS